MRTSKGKFYSNDLDALDQYRMQIKSVRCPYCQTTGFLIGHGFLRGYRENSQEKEIRGRRFFCSNRNYSNGCGHTFSVLRADRIRSFMLPASTLWSFLKGVREGLTRKAAWERFMGSFSLETAYRIWRRLDQAQSKIRTRLANLSDPPDSPEISNPIFQMIDHLTDTFPIASCPVSAFQSQFQIPFFP